MFSPESNPINLVSANSPLVFPRPLNLPIPKSSSLVPDPAYSQYLLFLEILSKNSPMPILSNISMPT